MGLLPWCSEVVIKRNGKKRTALYLADHPTRNRLVYIWYMAGPGSGGTVFTYTPRILKKSILDYTENTNEPMQLYPYKQWLRCELSVHSFLCLFLCDHPVHPHKSYVWTPYGLFAANNDRLKIEEAGIEFGERLIRNVQELESDITGGLISGPRRWQEPRKNKVSELV